MFLVWLDEIDSRCSLLSPRAKLVIIFFSFLFFSLFFFPFLFSFFKNFLIFQKSHFNSHPHLFSLSLSLSPLSPLSPLLSCLSPLSRLSPLIQKKKTQKKKHKHKQKKKKHKQKKKRTSQETCTQDSQSWTK